MDQGRFRKLLDHLQIGVVVHAPDTSILYSNSFASSLLGLTENEMEGKTASDPTWKFIDQDGTPIPLIDFPVNRVCKSLSKIRDQVIGIKKPDQESITWALCAADPIFNPKGELSEVVVNFTNITEEIALRTKYSELNLVLQAALDQSQAGILIADSKSGRLKYMNQAAFMMKSGLVGEHIKDLEVSKLLSIWKMSDLNGLPIPQDDTPLHRAIHFGEKISREVCIRLPDQEERVIWVSAAPVIGPDGAATYGIMVMLDTTERHRLEDQLRATQRLAEAATLAKTRFLDVAAHELRTPITVLSTLLQFTQQQYERGKSVERSTLDRLKHQVDRISRLVVDLLDVSRLERGALPIFPKLSNMNHVIVECLEDFKLHAPNRKINFDNFEPHEVFEFDPIRIYQVMMNLLENCRKYTPESSTVEIKLEKLPGRVRVSVTDHGPGIPDKEQGILFMPFSRGSAELTERSGGLGLGLFICKKIIELHHGRIGATSKKGTGSTFYFELPTIKKSQ